MLTDRPSICLVTSGQPSTNPRLVKEADALAEAGYDVRVVAARFAAWADAADREFEGRPWRVEAVRFGEVAPRPLRAALALRRRAAGALSDRLPGSAGLAVRALHYVVPELARLASARPAALYVAHNLAALPAAARAARRHGARLGFDAEDFHRGELADTPANARTLRVVRLVEETFVPRCHYVTAASDGIAGAYAEALGVERPTTVLNVFPLAERDVAVAPAELAAEVPEGARSLHWFSQTIGAGRGLEDAVRALPLLPDDVVLSLRGAWAAGYERELRAEADRLGVGRRLRALPLCPPAEVVRRVAEHHVGLALEMGETVNRDLCVTNKLFTYLLAGLPFVATDTTGQRAVCERLPEATRLYDAGDAAAFADAARSLLGHPGAAAAAERAGTQKYNWEAEQGKLLAVVKRVVGHPKGSVNHHESSPSPSLSSKPPPLSL